MKCERKLGDVKDVAKRLHCHKATIWRQVAEGNLPRPFRIGGRTLWDLHEIDAFIESKIAERDQNAA